MNQNIALQATGISIKLGGKSILNNINLTIGNGEVWGILGPNGSGKTTLFRIILGYLSAQTGHVSVFGEPNPNQYRAEMGIVLDDFGFDPYMSGKANLQVASTIKNLSYNQDYLPWVQTFDLEQAINQRTKNYSFGMKKRLGLIAAFAGNPKLLLLDEPANGLDIIAQRTLSSEIGRYSSRGGSVLLSSHTMADVEKTCSHALLIHKGNILATGTLEEVSKGFNNLEESFLSKINNRPNADQ
jgi:ABC-2 type transport system ATP-binding protein